MNVRRPNPEQDAIVAASRDRSNNISAAAGAGTGKTTTMVAVANANPYAKILYIAYNASTKEEGKKRFPKNTRVVTSHGLAYGSIGKEYAHRLNGRQPKSRAAAVMMGLPQETQFAYCVTCDMPVQGAGSFTHTSHAVVVERLQGWRIASLVKRTAERFCYSADREITAKHAPAKQQGIDERVWPSIRQHVARLAWEWWLKDLTQLDGQLWFWPDIYLKMYQMSRPLISQRIIILDEAQDTNDCVWDIVKSQTGKQIILVGDSNQMIYEWRGATDVMNKLDEMGRPSVRLQLTGSYRFGSAVAEEANLFLAMLDSDLRLRGYRRLESEVAEVYEGESSADCAIYRTNAGCIGGAVAALEMGLRVAIVGGGNAIEYLAEAALSLLNGRPTDHPELVGFENWDQVREYCKEEPEDAGTLIPIVKAIDEYGPQAIIDMTRQLVKEEEADFTVTTCHKAKGREWGHVIIGDDFPQPLPGKKMRKEELRLAYVAITRGKLVVELGSLAYGRQVVASSDGSPEAR